MSTDDAPTAASLPARADERHFSTLSTRSPALLWGLCMAILVESVALEALVSARHPLIGKALIAISGLSAFWLIDDYFVVAKRPIMLRPQALVLQRGRLMRLVVPLSEIARIFEPTWKEVPAAGTSGYLSLAGPSGPNILVELTVPAILILPAGLRRRARRIGLRLDDPGGFVHAVEEARAAASGSALSSVPA